MNKLKERVHPGRIIFYSDEKKTSLWIPSLIPKTTAISASMKKTKKTKKKKEEAEDEDEDGFSGRRDVPAAKYVACLQHPASAMFLGPLPPLERYPPYFVPHRL